MGIVVGPRIYVECFNKGCFDTEGENNTQATVYLNPRLSIQRHQPLRSRLQRSARMLAAVPEGG